MEISASAREVLTSALPAHVATLDPDGTPHVSIAWVGIEDGEIVFGTVQDQRKLRNLRRDPRVTVSVLTPNKNPMGLDEYLVVYGEARVTEGGAPKLLNELAQVYMGPGAEFPPPGVPEGFVTRITPLRFAGLGPWTAGE